MPALEESQTAAVPTAIVTGCKRVTPPGPAILYRKVEIELPVTLKVTPIVNGVEVIVGVEVTVAVAVRVGEFVAVAVGVTVKVKVGVPVAVEVSVNVGLKVDVEVAVFVAVKARVLVGVGVKVEVGVPVRVLVKVWVKVEVGTGDKVLVGVSVGFPCPPGPEGLELWVPQAKGNRAEIRSKDKIKNRFIHHLGKMRNVLIYTWNSK
jgi:hypothetical protein